MKTKLLLCLLLIGSMTSVNAQKQIANFEDGTLTEFLECVIEGNGVTSFEVVDNPETTGLNASTKALKVVNGNGEDWGGLAMKLKEQIIVSENRYVHIMMKFQNVGIQNFHFAVFSSDNEKWSALTNAQSEWFDYVIDLNNVENTALSNVVTLRYLPRSANYTNPGNVVHIDEMIANNDPMPRGGYNYIDEACTIAGFEDGTYNDLACSNDGNGVASFEVADNPATNEINNSAKALKFVVADANVDWWPGLLVMFPKVVLVTEETRYLHIMSHNTSEDQSYEFNIYADGEMYQGEKPTTAGWKDHVFDLNDKMGKTISGFRYCTRTDKPNNLGKTRYLDEIAFSADPTPRTSATTSLQSNTISDVNIFNFSNGIIIQGVEGEFAIYNVSGALIQTGLATGNTQVNLSKGFYIVRIDAKSYKVSVN